MSYNVDLFSKIEEYDKKRIVTFGDYNAQDVQGQGVVTLQTNSGEKCVVCS